MHIVVMAWLFVIGTMALTWPSVLGGVAFFAAAGVAPVALYAWLKLRRLRGRRRWRKGSQCASCDGRSDAGG